MSQNQIDISRVSKSLIIDSSYLIYRSHFAYPRLTFLDKPVGAFYGFVKTVLSLVKIYKPDNLIFTNDTPVATWRHKALPSYKQNRTPPDPEMIDQIPLIQAWSAMASQNFFKVEGFEADDLIFTTAYQILQDSFLKHHPAEITYLQGQNEFEATLIGLAKLVSKINNPEILIFSSDRDLYQMLVNTGVKFIHSKKQGEMELFGAGDFIKKYDLQPTQWLDYKALVGDASDNLPGLSGVGPITAVKFLQTVGSLYECFKQESEHSRFIPTGVLPVENYKDLIKVQPAISKVYDNLVQNRHVVEKTYLLSQLSLVPQIELSANKFNFLNTIGLLREYGFNSLIKEIYSIEGEPIRTEPLF